MPKPTDESRRRFLKYTGATLVAAAVAGIGYYYFGYNPKPGVTTTTTATLSPLASYAKSKDISQTAIDEMGQKLNSDKLTDGSRGLVDALFDYNQSEILSPDALKLAPEYRPVLVEADQVKIIDQVVVDGKVPDDTTAAIGYLFSPDFSGYTKRWHVEQHGLDDSAIQLLNVARGLGDQNFARYAVGSLLFIQDHHYPLTSAEIAVLENPGKFATVRDGYLDQKESQGNPWDDYVKDWRKLLKRAVNQDGLPLEKEMESLDATEDWTTIDWIDGKSIKLNPEVMEAEGIKFKGGTPDPSDYGYTVPDYNTAQRIQYELGKQEEYRRDDTTAQAIPTVDGLFVTMGTDEVRQAVLLDDTLMLRFGRETADIQRGLGFSYNLEDYPLLEKTLWAWRGNLTPIDGPMQLTRYRESKLPLNIYQWMTPRIDTLIKMRELVKQIGWDKDVNKTIANLEYYFYFNQGLTQSSHWEYTAGDKEIIVDGIQVSNGYIHNMNWMLRHYLETGKGIGQCSVEASWINTLAKSVGISSSINMNQFKTTDGKYYGHSHSIYFDPSTNSWKAYKGQLEADAFTFNGITDQVNMYIFRPPFNQKGYLKQWDERMLWNGNSVYLEVIDVKDIVKKFSDGAPSSVMKKWLIEYQPK